MTAKTYFTIAGVFIALYIITTLGVIVGMPDWVHQVCTVVFATSAFLGLRQKKKESQNQ